MKKGKKFELHDIFLAFKNEMKASDIAKKFELSKSNLSYYIKKLKDLKVLKYTGNGIWEITGDLKVVQKSVGTHSPLLPEFIKRNPKKEIRGHAFIWKIVFGADFDWKRLLDSSTLKKKYKTQSSGKVLRVLFQGRKIWLQKNGSATVFEPFDYFGRNAYESKGLAVYNLDRLLKSLLKKLNQKNCFYKFTTSRVHYALIKNEVARQFNDRGEKLHVRTEDGTEWLWIDFSKGDGEFEVGNLKEETEEVSVKSQVWYNDHKKTKFAVTPTFVLNTMNGIQQNQSIFDKNMKSHLDVLGKLGNAVDKLTREVSKLKSDTKDI